MDDILNVLIPLVKSAREEGDVSEVVELAAADDFADDVDTGKTVVITSYSIHYTKLYEVETRGRTRVYPRDECTGCGPRKSRVSGPDHFQGRS